MAGPVLTGFISLLYALLYDADLKVGGFSLLIPALTFGIQICGVILIFCLIPAALLLLTLFVLAHFGKRVLRPKAHLYAFILGAMACVLVFLGTLAPVKTEPLALFLAAALGALPSTVFAVFLTRRPVPTGHCFHCGYDLRASKERCPECGTAVPGDLVEATKSSPT